MNASKTDESNKDSLYSTASKNCEVRSDEMFHGVRELRKRSKEDNKQAVSNVWEVS